jgi:hypothetical protein
MMTKLSFALEALRLSPEDLETLRQPFQHIPVLLHQEKSAHLPSMGLRKDTDLCLKLNCPGYRFVDRIPASIIVRYEH